MDIKIKKLTDGYARFREFQLQQPNSTYQNIMKQAQKPLALVITCCDARIDPVMIFDCAPGDLFMIRNVANLIPPYEEDSHYHGTSAALEFGIRYLEIPHIIVLGHTQCGGIHSLFEKHTDGPNSFIQKWMELAQVPFQSASNQPADIQESLCGKQALLGSLQNLMTFPWIKERVKTGNLQLHAWYLHLPEGSIDVFHPDTLSFVPLTD